MKIVKIQGEDVDIDIHRTCFQIEQELKRIREQKREKPE